MPTIKPTNMIEDVFIPYGLIYCFKKFVTQNFLVVYDMYKKEELEKIAESFEGIDRSYAIQAGREVRVFVRPEELDDFKATTLARDIAKKIEEELKYPGEIKVNVIREMRVIEYAR